MSIIKLVEDSIRRTCAFHKGSCSSTLAVRAAGRDPLLRNVKLDTIKRYIYTILANPESCLEEVLPRTRPISFRLKKKTSTLVDFMADNTKKVEKDGADQVSGKTLVTVTTTTTVTTISAI